MAFLDLWVLHTSKEDVLVEDISVSFNESSPHHLLYHPYHCKLLHSVDYRDGIVRFAQSQITTKEILSAMFNKSPKGIKRSAVPLPCYKLGVGRAADPIRDDVL